MIKLDKTKWYKGFIEVICYSYILLFVYAATSKLIAYDKFIVQIGQSAMLSAYAGVLAWLVPASELVLAAMLVFLRWRLIGLYGSFGLMAAFTIYIFMILNAEETKPCSCGGILEKLGWPEHMVFNIVFVVLGVIGIVLHQVVARPAPDGGLPRGSG